jgi:hypothetical protein
MPSTSSSTRVSRSGWIVLVAAINPHHFIPYGGIAERLELLGDAAQVKELAEFGHERVREHFLLPRLLLSDLPLMLDLQGERPTTTTSPPRREARPPGARDGRAIEGWSAFSVPTWEWGRPHGARHALGDEF